MTGANALMSNVCPGVVLRVVLSQQNGFATEGLRCSKKKEKDFSCRNWTRL